MLDSSVALSVASAPLDLARGAQSNTSSALFSPSSPDAGANFADLLTAAGAQFRETLATAERVSSQAAAGHNVSLDEIIAAVTKAELSINTVVAIRDRVISVYQEIMRMPI